VLCLLGDYRDGLHRPMRRMPMIPTPLGGEIDAVDAGHGPVDSLPPEGYRCLERGTLDT